MLTTLFLIIYSCTALQSKNYVLWIVKENFQTRITPLLFCPSVTDYTHQNTISTIHQCINLLGVIDLRVVRSLNNQIFYHINRIKIII